MSLQKLIDRIGQGSMTEKMSRSTNSWTKFKSIYEKNMMYKSGTNTLCVMTVHERNGSRGEGMGMGHRNKQGKNKQ